MSDISHTATISPTSARRRRGRAQRLTITVDGKSYKPRNDVANTAGISPRTAARVFKNQTVYVAGIAYVDEQAALRDLVSPPARGARHRRKSNV